MPKAAEVSTEVISMHEANTKHFKVAENTYEAIVFSHPVHQLDNNGNWQDIDFSMTYAENRGLPTY